LKICFRKEDRFCIEEWLQYPSFLKLVHGEQVWINTYLSAKRNGASGPPLFTYSAFMLNTADIGVHIRHQDPLHSEPER
jgi:hypothetical protein